jgi:hypothetical protein
MHVPAAIVDDFGQLRFNRRDVMNDPELTPAEHADVFATLGKEEFGANLDYSVESIDIVDRILQMYVGGSCPDDRITMLIIVGVGCYVGEILVREGLADRWVDAKDAHFPGKQPDIPLGVALRCKKTRHSMYIEDEKWDEYFFILPIATAINIYNGMKTSMKRLYHHIRTVQLCPGAEQAPKPEAN